jgi:hypothetical protein
VVLGVRPFTGEIDVIHMAFLEPVGIRVGLADRNEPLSDDHRRDGLPDHGDVPEGVFTFSTPNSPDRGQKETCED